jgi:hypothetical protein
VIRYLVPRREAYTIHEFLERWGKPLAGRLTLEPYEDLPARRELSAGAYIFSALDHLTPSGQGFATAVASHLRGAGPGFRLLNSPDRALLRFELLEELHRRGWNSHRAVRASDDVGGLRYPVFVRDERWHTGSLSPLLRTRAELEAALARSIVRGHRLADLLAVEFTDTADAGGVFRKYAAFRVGPAIVPRSVALGRHWMLKFEGSEHTESSYREEAAYVRENPHEDALRRVFEVAGVDYGRIDYAMKDGSPVVWEINLNPSIGRGLRPAHTVLSDRLRSQREGTKAHFYARFLAAFEVIDVADQASPVRMPPAPDAARPLTFVERPNRFAAARKLLRPARPLIDRLASAASPLLLFTSRLLPPRARARP